MLDSAEPQAMKSTVAMVALNAIRDPSAFLELNSTTGNIALISTDIQLLYVWFLMTWRETEGYVGGEPKHCQQIYYCARQDAEAVWNNHRQEY